MTKKQLARFGELLLVEANELKARAEAEKTLGKFVMSDFYATASMAVFKTHKAVLALAEETE